MAVREGAAGRRLGRPLDVEVRPPLFIVTGTMGAGKSATAELLARMLPECAVFDIDWAIASLGMVAGKSIHSSPETWPGVNDTWLAIAGALARSGQSTVLCGPFAPRDLADLPSYAVVGEIHWLLLDCADAAIRSRLKERAWKDEDIEDALADAADLRSLGVTAIRTDNEAPSAVAEFISDWVRDHLSRIQ